MKAKFNFKEFKKVVKETTTEEMTRMEAWKAVAAEVPQLDWESFKRIQPLAERKRK